MISISGSALTRVDRASAIYRKLEDAHPRIAAKDSMLWGVKAAAEASVRLNWVDLPSQSLGLISQLQALSAKIAPFDRVILCGMGGSSLAPEVLAATYSKEIFILDSTDPNYLAHALSGALAKTVVVVSSKSGSTIETASQRLLLNQRFIEAGLDPLMHFIFVTDPGSPLDLEVRALGHIVVNADPKVGGRFSALTAFGLVPATLIGIDPTALLAQAQQTKESFISDPQNILDVAYLLTEATSQYITFDDYGSNVPGLSSWIEQLIAESTGKDGVGRLPIAIQGPSTSRIGSALAIAFGGKGADLIVEGSLASHFIFWEWVTALIGLTLGIDPFNQPNVTEAKEQTSSLLTKWQGIYPQLKPDLVDSEVEIFGDGQSLKDALATLIEGIRDGGYLAIMAYLDRDSDVAIAELRSILSIKADKPTSFGWGPRFLHSTGQFHKGGPKNGSFLQITGNVASDYEIPGQNFGFKTLVAAQALGDGQALASRRYPLLRLNCRDRSVAIAEIIAAAKAL